jgi:hypothetical protein
LSVLFNLLANNATNFIGANFYHVILGSIQSLGLTFHGLVVAKSGTPSHFYWERIKNYSKGECLNL